jgi:hypothetical protein
VEVGLTRGVTVHVWNVILSCMESAGSFKTLVFFYQTLQCHMPEDCDFDIN